MLLITLDITSQLLDSPEFAILYIQTAYWLYAQAKGLKITLQQTKQNIQIKLSENDSQVQITFLHSVFKLLTAFQISTRASALSSKADNE